MASEFSRKGQRGSFGLSSALASAVSEWLLMLLLFLDGLFSYIVTKFAQFCKLQSPCLLCSRLDHILGSEKPGFCRDLLCNAHKLEISSLAYCHVHGNLADVRELCEACLLSFATENKSNSDTYRSLVRKLEMDVCNSENVHPKLPPTVDFDAPQNKVYGEDTVVVPLIKKDQPSCPSHTLSCSCCNAPFSTKPHAPGFLQMKSIGAGASDHGVPLTDQSRLGNSHYSDLLNKKKKQALGLPTSSLTGNRSLDPLAHVGYTELKITSDSESEVPFSDDDDGSTLIRQVNDTKEEVLSRCRQLELIKTNPEDSCKTLSGNSDLEKLIHTAPIISEPSFPDTERHHVGDPPDIQASASNVAHGLEELDWNHVKERDIPPSPYELVSVQIPTEASSSQLVGVKICHPDCISSTTSGEVTKSLISNEINLKTREITIDPGRFMPGYMDLNDAYKLAVSNKGNQTSFKDSSKVPEDLKLWLSQITPARGLDIPWNDVTPSPRVHALVEDFKISDVSISAAVQNIAKRLSIDRNESGIESLDGSIISEIEGESAIDRLKRQLELDRKSMSLLYKELDEERSASAIAANQAMAMITRLQEEKAAMQMEALQYQRMMEEQAEYDQEALQNANDLLAQREKEIQDLEAEVESCKSKLENGLLACERVDSMADSEERASNFVHLGLYNRSRSVGRHGETAIGSLDSEGDKSGILNSCLLDFGEDKTSILECLKRLEKQLHLFSNYGIYAGVSGLDAKKDAASDSPNENGQYSGRETHGGSDLQQDSSVTTEGISVNARCSSSVQGKHSSFAEPDYDDRREKSSLVSRENDLVAIGYEVSQLTERMEALEADRNFLEHTINSLRNGSEGIRFIREIACHLRELRRIGVRRREQTVT